MSARVAMRRPGWAAGTALSVLALSAGLVPSLEASEPLPSVVDLHVDLPYRAGYKGAPFREGSGQFRASDLVAAGLGGVVLPLFVPRDATPQGRTAGEFEASYSRVFSSILETPPYALPGCGVGRAAGEHRPVTTWLSFEGAEAIEPTRAALGLWTLRGVRLFGLVHSQHNSLAESSGEPSRGQGLTERGRTFASVVLDLGGVLDVSHASDEATEQLIAMARDAGKPIVASHSNARALANHPRNLTDAQIRGIAASGGVIGVNFYSRFLAPRTNRASIDDVVAQIRYLVRVGGLGVVAIGSDYEGGISTATGLESAGRFPRLDQALSHAGFSRDERRQILGDNARRVLCAREKFATSIGP